MSEAVRMILADDADPDGLSDLAFDEGWLVTTLMEPDDDEGLPYEAGWKSDTGARIHYVEDDTIGVRYVAVSGQNVEETVAKIKERVDVLSKDQVLSGVADATTAEEAGRAVYRVGALAPSKHAPAFVSPLRQALRHDDPDVRNAAIFAMGYMEWPALRAILREVAADDPDPDVRHSAELMLEAYDKTGVEPPPDPG